MQAKNVFTGSKLNKDIDERLLQNGEYPHAENIRVSDSDSFNGGIVENLRGNEQVTDFGLTNAVTIGLFADTNNQKIYMFTTSDEKDIVVEYDHYNQLTTVLLESSKPNSVLNFNPNYLITGINKIYNEDKRKDLLFWTDDYNPPRVINIERAKTYAVDGFTQKDMSVIKTPPLNAPSLTPFMSTDISQNNLENKFVSFSYRYKYLDGEYSALSPFTYYSFTPDVFGIDFDSLENTGMVNSLNSVNIEFNTGDYRVVGIDVVYKESNSNTVYLVESFDKKKQGWNDNQLVNFDFSNSKQYIALPAKELSRLYDNVPRLAKAQEFIGNRLIYGNYLENYNVVDEKGNDIVIDYSVGITSKTLDDIDVPLTFDFDNPVLQSNILELDLNSVDLIKGMALTFSIDLNEVTFGNGNCIINTEYILKQDYADPSELVADQDFIDFFEITLTQIFEATFTHFGSPPNSDVDSITGFVVSYDIGTDTILITCPSIEYLINSTPPTQTSLWQYDTILTNVSYRLNYDKGSLKSNRSYEAAIIYQDDEGRCSTCLTTINNTVNNPHANAVKQNRLSITIENKPPYWATKYKIAIKENKGKYEEIYANVFYEDSIYRWIKLESDNKNKVKEGDFLYIKHDLNGFVPTLQRVKVLDLVQQLPDFIPANTTTERGGLYMKIKPPVSISMTYDPDNYHRYVENTATSGTGAFVSLSIPNTWAVEQGDYITLYARNVKGGSSGGDYTYSQAFTVSANYASLEEWFYTEVGNILPFTTVSFPSPNNIRIYALMNGNGQHKSRLDGEITIRKNSGLIVFETVPEDKISEIYFESSENFDIVDGFHLGNVQDQTTSTPAVIEIGYFNCYTFGNGIESNSYRSNSFSNYISMDLRPTTTSIEKYKENRRFADLTYSGSYNDSANMNQLNNFNLSTANFKDDIEKGFGSIQKIIARDNNLLVLQEDKISQVFYGKSILLNADGTGNLGKIEDVLGEQNPYTGEYGVSRNPESVSVFGNRVYFLDSKRGTPLRLSNDGITEINDTISNYFREKLTNTLNTKKVGAYDPCNDQFVLSDDTINIYPDDEGDCGVTKRFKNVSQPINTSVKLGEKTGDVYINYEVENGTIDIATDTGKPYYDSDLTGSGQIIISKNIDDNTSFKFKIIPVSGTPNVNLTVPCITGNPIKVVNIIINDDSDVGKTMKSRMRWVDGTYVSSYKTYDTIFNPSNLTLFEALEGFEGVNFLPIEGSTVKMESYKATSNTGVWFDNDRMRYLVSSTEYTSADLSTILSLSTEMAYSTSVYPSGDVVRSSEFVLNRPVGDEIVYLIWDYSGEIEAVDDEYSCPAYQQVIMDVMSNDIGVDTGEYSGLTPVIQTAPVNGTAEVTFDKRIKYTSASTLSDTLEYVLVNEDESFTSNVATVTINVESGYVAGKYFSSSSTPTSNCAGAGIEDYPVFMYHLSIGDYPSMSVGTIIYTDVSLTTAFVGDGDWYHISPTLSVRIDASGVITEISNCS